MKANRDLEHATAAAVVSVALSAISIYAQLASDAAASPAASAVAATAPPVAVPVDVASVASADGGVTGSALTNNQLEQQQAPAVDAAVPVDGGCAGRGLDWEQVVIGIAGMLVGALVCALGGGC